MGNERVVFVAGASSGIGEALAREYASRGAALALVARRQDRLEKLARDIVSVHRSAIAVVGDVTRDGDLEHAVRMTLNAFGRIDVVVANAGFGVTGPIEKLGLEDFRRQFETNVFGVLRTVYATLDAVKETRGSYALIGSVSGYLASPGSGPYTMSKYAVRGLAQTMQIEFARYGISTTHIAPGFIETEIRTVDNKGRFRSERKDFVPRFLRMSAEAAAREIADATDAREPERVLTRHGKLGVFLGKHAAPLTTRAMKAARFLERARTK